MLKCLKPFLRLLIRRERLLCLQKKEPNCKIHLRENNKIIFNFLWSNKSNRKTPTCVYFSGDDRIRFPVLFSGPCFKILNFFGTFSFSFICFILLPDRVQLMARCACVLPASNRGSFMYKTKVLTTTCRATTAQNNRWFWDCILANKLPLLASAQDCLLATKSCSSYDSTQKKGKQTETTKQKITKIMLLVTRFYAFIRMQISV